jgi:hypothetical protein
LADEKTGRVNRFVTIGAALFSATFMAGITGGLVDCVLAAVCSAVDRDNMSPSQHGWGAAVMVASGIASFVLVHWLIRRPRNPAQPA